MNEVINQIMSWLFYKNPFFWAIIISAIISVIFEKRITGKAGEFWVKRELNKLDKQKYLIINDLTIKSDNLTHQIDHVVVSKYGIFVIETKQYNGYIKGNEFDNKWIQNNKIYINNPIHQNYGHVKSLENVLNLPENKFIPIICIPSTAKVNVKSKNHVVKIYDLNKIILSYTSEIILDYKNIYSQIVSLNITDKDILKQHVSYVKKLKKTKLNYDYVNKCPLCGGNLVERAGKYGKFIGCSNFPKCKYTKNIK